MNDAIYQNNFYQGEKRVIEPLPENAPEILKNGIYTPGFLRKHIGKLMRVEFLIGTTYLEDRIGILEEVGASYIVLRSIESNNLVYCDIYSIKFITISQDNYIYNPDFQV